MATIVNLFIPGLGQLMQGRLLMGLMLFTLTIIGYLLFILPGLFIHLLTLVDSAQFEAQQKKREHREMMAAMRRR